jgi:hypothetical protein
MKNINMSFILDEDPKEVKTYIIFTIKGCLSHLAKDIMAIIIKVKTTFHSKKWMYNNCCGIQ